MTILSKGKKLIFDFDGTLVDSMKQWADKMIHILERNNIKYPSDIIDCITPLGDKGAIEYFINNLGLKVDVNEAVKEINDEALDWYLYEILAKDTVVPTLKILKEKCYSLNVLTASPHIMLDPCLRRNQMFDLFDNVWSCEDFSTTKADVNIYYKVAQRLNCEVCDCVFFDDNLGALTTAAKAGMMTVGVYDESAKSSKEKIAELCDAYIHKFEEILR